MVNEIKEARKAARLTQASMSKLLGIPMRTIQNWELGKRACPDYVKRFVLRELEQIKEGNAESPK